ncbi:hypothetical protein [Geobacillus jurassicus]|uniref:Transposase n=1 Tax=Geobacillus jurassicus TaxID=235932 RepID=A0ABV6GTD4_9BACL|nr:hypothetical protein [Geobacillus jurassicus]
MKAKGLIDNKQNGLVGDVLKAHIKKAANYRLRRPILRYMRLQN